MSIHVCSAAACNIQNSNAQLGDLCDCNTGFFGVIDWNEDTNVYNGSCLVRQCGAPPIKPKNGFVKFTDSNNDGSVATFTCNPGFELSLTNSVKCSTTSAGRDWPSVTPTCNGFVRSHMQCTHTLTVLTHSCTLSLTNAYTYTHQRSGTIRCQ